MRHATRSVVAVEPAILLEGYPADHDFPQFETACDPRRMLEIFRAHLNRQPPASSSATER